MFQTCTKTLLDRMIIDSSRMRLHWPRFSLRTSLIASVVLGIASGVVGWMMREAHRQRSRVAELGEYGVIYLSDSWIPEWLDIHYQDRITSIVWREEDLTPLADFDQAVHLRLLNSRVSDLTLLKTFDNMAHLVIDCSNVDDLSPLTEMDKLEWLYLYNAKEPKQLRVLAESDSLKDFHVHFESHHDNIMALTALKNVETLWLYNTHDGWESIHHEQHLYLDRALPQCEVCEGRATFHQRFLGLPLPTL